MNSESAREQPMLKLLKRLSASRFFTISIVLHAILVLLLGGAVLFRAPANIPDFEAGSEGLMSEAEDHGPPNLPEISQPSDQQFTPAAPALAAPLSALVSATQQAPSWTVSAVPNVPTQGLSDSMMASVNSKLGKAGGSAGGGLAGRLGSMRTATIFGKKIEAAKLGVVLDVSGSGHKHLAGAIEEIQKAFADATLILYPGCGLMDYDGRPLHSIRKYSSLTKKDLDPAATNFTTPGQLNRALKIPAFEQMTLRPSVKDTLYVSWYDEAEGKAPILIGRTQVALEYLMTHGSDTIYWFADFQDKVEPKVVEHLAVQLKNRKIKLHVHNFAGQKVQPEIVQLAENSGGTVNTEAAK